MGKISGSIGVDTALPLSVPLLYDREFYITQSLLDELSEYGQSSPKREVCGLVTGTFDQFLRAETFHPIKNISNDDYGFDDYKMDPNESMAVLKHTQFVPIDEHKFDLVATFHTHPRSTPYPSIIDIEYAAYNVVYIIYSVVLNKFSFNFWNGEWFVPVNVKVSK